jgi:hypothetical protein
VVRDGAQEPAAQGGNSVDFSDLDDAAGDPALLGEFVGRGEPEGAGSGHEADGGRQVGQLLLYFRISIRFLQAGANW